MLCILQTKSLAVRLWSSPKYLNKVINLKLLIFSVQANTLTRIRRSEETTDLSRLRIIGLIVNTILGCQLARVSRGDCKLRDDRNPGLG